MTVSGVWGMASLAGFILLWLVGLNIDWDCPVPHCIMGSCDQWESPPFAPPPQWQSLCTVLTTGKCLPSWVLCQGTVKESSEKLMLYIEGILAKGPYLPCVIMAGRALLAGYHRYMDHENFRIWIGWYSSKLFKSCRHSKFDPFGAETGVFWER